MKINQLTIMKTLIKFVITFVSFLFLIIYIWFRFIRERLPRDIPFNLTLFGCIIIIFVCLSLICSIIISLLVFKDENNIFKSIKKYYYKPLEIVILFIIEYKPIKSYYNKFLISFTNFIENTSKFKIYLIIELLPRIILLCTFIIDVFYFHSIKYFYNVIFIAILPLLSIYILHALKYIVNNTINNIDQRAELYCYNISSIETVMVVPGIISHIVPTLSAKELVNQEIQRIINGLQRIDYLPSFRLDYVKSLRKTLNIPDTNSFNSAKFKVNIRKAINLVISLQKSILLYEEKYSRYRYIKIGIFSMYLISWMYILIKSIHTLNPESIETILETFKDIIEPFSGLDIF